MKHQLHYFIDGNLESLLLSDEIMNDPYSANIKWLEKHKYDKVGGDPIEHVIEFNSKLMFHVSNALLTFKLFPITLRKEGFRWFTKLKPKLVSSRKQLQEIFMKCFQHNRSKKKVISILFLMQQVKGEALHKFIHRFREATFKVHKGQVRHHWGFQNITCSRRKGMRQVLEQVQNSEFV